MIRTPSAAWDTVALLALFEEAGRLAPQHGNIKTQKLVFLVELGGQEMACKLGHFRFFRYHMGPYSPSLARHVETLEEAKVLTRHRTLAPKGKFILDYVSESLLGQAEMRTLEALDVAREVGRKFGSWSGDRLRSYVYGLTVPVFDWNNKLCKVDDIGTGWDIIHPEQDARLSEISLPSDIAQDVMEELALPPESLDPDNQGFKRTVAAAVSRATATCG